MAITDYSGEYRQLAEAERQLRAVLQNPDTSPVKIALLDQDLAEIQQVRFWLDAGGTGIRSTLVNTIEALVERVADNCTRPV